VTLLALVAAASAGWAAFLWRQLIAARAGAEPFCVFGKADCAQLWDGAFASWIHSATRVPVAGWGVAWSLVALLLPLGLLLGLEARWPLRGTRAAMRWTALAGVLTIAVLLAASLRAGTFCSNCAITYGLTLLYAAIALRGLQKSEIPWSERGLFTAVLLTLAAYAALIYPGLQTPRARGAAALEALVRASQNLQENVAPSRPNASRSDPTDDLIAFIDSLPAPLQESLSTTLALYRNAPARPTETPRAAHGNPDAPVVITEFVDTLCSHCADLHDTMQYLLDAAPDRFALDSRHYPLDGNCNADLPVRGPETVRCLAARVEICAENAATRFGLTTELFAGQSSLTTERVLEIAAKHLDPMSLDACLTDPRTERKLMDDVAFASRYDPTGTPLVLVNGREGSPYGPFLLAMILAQGDADHPAFGVLPTPRAAP
jgi:serine/threonine-protein kinase